MKWFRFLLRFLFSVYGLATLVAGLLIIFPLVLVASLWGKVNGGNFIYTICRAWSAAELAIWGITHKNIFEVPHDSKQQYVFVFNHISYMDIPVLMLSIRKQQFRILGKAELSKVPIFGFLYRNTVVLVERDNAAKRAKSVQQLKSIIKKGISVVIAPEGTFNTTHKPLKEFYDGAFRVAIETQTPIKPILFLDTYSRLSYKSIFSLTPGKSRSFFLDEISVEGLTTSDTKMLKEKTWRIMEEKLIAYKAAWINEA